MMSSSEFLFLNQGVPKNMQLRGPINQIFVSTINVFEREGFSDISSPTFCEMSWF